MKSFRAITKIVSSVALSTNDLFRLRMTSTAYKDVVDNYSFDVWTRVLTKKDIEKAFRLGHLYMVEQSYLAHLWCIKNQVEFEIIPDVREFDFDEAFVKNTHEKIDEVFIKEGFLEKKYDGETAFIYTAVSGSIDRLKRLVSAGADINARNDKGETALFFADNDNLDYICTLQGVNLDAKNDEGKTALMKRVDLYEDYPQYITPLLQVGVDPNAQDNEGETALMTACYCVNLDPQEFVEELVNAGANINLVGKTGFSTIMYLCAQASNFIDEEHLEIYGETWRGSEDSEAVNLLDYLLEGGADLKIVNNFGFTVFHYAIDSFYILEKLIEYAEKQNLLYLLDIKNRKGDTILLELAKKGNAYRKSIELLIEVGADLTIRDSNGHTAEEILGEEDWEKILQRIEFRNERDQPINEESEDEKILIILDSIWERVDDNHRNDSDINNPQETLDKVLNDKSIPSKELFDFEYEFDDYNRFLRMYGIQNMFNQGGTVGDMVKALIKARNKKLGIN